MSFDTVFDYTGAITHLQNTSNICNTNISVISTKIQVISELGNAFPYLKISDDRTMHLIGANVVEHQILAQQQSSLSSIYNVVNLDESHKSNIYNCYKFCLENTYDIDLPQLMGKLVCHTQSIANDIGNITLSVGDASMSSNQGNTAAIFVYNNYAINDDDITDLLSYFPTQ